MKLNRTWLNVIVLSLLVLYGILKISNLTGSSDVQDPCSFEERIDPDDLVVVNHAQCRMRCRDISRELLEDVYLHGKVNCRKSSFKDDAPRYALEKEDALGDNIRVIVQVEGRKHLIITAIRLGKSDLCDCM